MTVRLSDGIFSSETLEIRPTILYGGIMYFTPCRLVIVIDCKMQRPRMTSSGYFMSKSVFGQQGCRALTFALAMLSCCQQCHCSAHKATSVGSIYQPMHRIGACLLHGPVSNRAHVCSPTVTMASCGFSATARIFCWSLQTLVLVKT